MNAYTDSQLHQLHVAIMHAMHANLSPHTRTHTHIQTQIVFHPSFGI